MSAIKVYDREGAEAGTVDVADDLLVRDRGEQAVHDAVVAHLAARRAGTASTLRKGEVCTKCHQPIPVVAIQHAIDCNRVEDERRAALAEVR